MDCCPRCKAHVLIMDDRVCPRCREVINEDELMAAPHSLARQPEPPSAAESAAAALRQTNRLIADAAAAWPDGPPRMPLPALNPGFVMASGLALPLLLLLCIAEIHDCGLHAPAFICGGAFLGLLAGLWCWARCSRCAKCVMGSGTAFLGPNVRGAVITKWICFFIPLLPVRSYVLARESSFMQADFGIGSPSAPPGAPDAIPLPGLGLCWKQVGKTYLKAVIGLVLFVVIMWVLYLACLWLSIMGLHLFKSSALPRD